MRRALLRDRAAPDHSRVGFIELFFDLVFVFAITRLSHLLLGDLTIEGALETTFLLFAVWTVWMWTTWATNWLDSRHIAVRLLLFALMAAGLIMSAAIPEAFGARGLAFACAYVFMQNLKNIFLVIALKKGSANVRKNFERVEVWLLVSAPLWIAGAFFDGAARWAFWALALFLEMGSPWWNLWVPGMGASTTRDWAVDTAHMSERCGLFIILALGESIVILGATFGDLHWNRETLVAFGLGLVAAAAMWWIYFATAAERAEHAFAHHRDAGSVARAAYTYAHIPIAAGIILVAVAGELVLAHPDHHAQGVLATIIGGPALFLGGNMIFSRMACGGWAVSHIAGLGFLAAAAVIGLYVSPLAIGALATGVLVLVAVWATLRPLRPRAARH